MLAAGNEDVPLAYEVTYYGFSVLDFNFSAAAFRWIVGELLELLPCGQGNIELAIRSNVGDGRWKVVGTQKKDADRTKLIVLEQDIDYIWKCFLWPDDGRCFAYLVRTNPDCPDTCHVFFAQNVDHATKFVKLLRQRKNVDRSVPLETLSDVGLPRDPFLKMVPLQNAPSFPCLSSSTEIVGNQNVDSSQFEVLYVCRVEIHCTSPSSSIVDEAARKYDEEYRTTQARQYVAASVRHLMSTGRSSQDDSGLRTRLRFSDTDSEAQMWEEPLETQQNVGGGVRRRRTSSLIVEALVDSVFLDDAYGSSPSVLGRKKSLIHESSAVASPSLADLMKTRASSSRAMLMSIGRHAVDLISLDQKQKLLTRRLTEISCVVQGAKYGNHFAFVCPDHWQRGKSDCFVVRCQDDAITSTAIRAMKTAFAAAFNDHVSAGGRQHVCDHCPLYQYSRLCSDIDSLKPRNLHDAVVNRINGLSPSHQELIWTGYKKLWNDRSDQLDGTNGGDMKGSHSESVQRKNIMLMSALRSVCESAQVLHSRSVGKIFNGAGDGKSAAAAPAAATEHEICLTAIEGASNSVGAKREKCVVGKCNDGGSAAAPYQRFSAANKLVSLRDRAKNAFGGSLDSFIKRKLNNNDNEVAGSTLTLKEETSVPSRDGEGDVKPIIILSNEDMEHEKRDVGGEETTHTFSPPLTPLSPAGAMTGSHATFYFETPDRLGSDNDIRFRQRSSTVGDAFAFSASGDRKATTTSEHILRDKHTLPLVGYPNSSGGRTNRSLANMVAMRGRRMSWRQAIFTRVVSPRLFVSRHSVAGLGPVLDDDSPASIRSSGVSPVSTPSPVNGGGEDASQPAFYRSLWKKAIMEQILAMRLESQKKLRGEEADELRKLKLTYEEITPCSEEEVRPVWLAMLNDPKRHTTRFDRVRVEEAVKAGVPRDLRSEVWKFLLSQHLLDRGKRSQMETPPSHQYRDVLKDLTSYQHAILIDLGRTFPTHNYFSQSLGSGQLSLFNILKAYSLFDTEVGYCQGLSFVAGVLLLHMEEEDAFEMLVDMMYRLQLRRHYRPDMMALQIEMYQLSRLVHDRHKDLHDHLEEHEIPILYAAPWFLTLFASAFPLGFVARVFDFVFLAGGLDVVFKIALILLGDHKELIKHCDSFESINDFLKTTLPLMSIIQMERVFNQVFELDISRDLLAYEVEYHVLQEEVLASPAGVPSTAPAGMLAKQTSAPCRGSELTKLDTANRFLKRQNMELLEQLQQAHYKLALAEKVKLEIEAKLDAANDVASSCQCKINSLETRVDALELERKSLLATVQRLRAGSSNASESSGPKTNGAATSPVQRSSTNIPPSRGSTGTSAKMCNAIGHRTCNSK